MEMTMQSLQSPHQKMQSFQIFNACAQTASCCCKVLIAQPAPFKFLCLLLLLQLQATKQHVVFVMIFSIGDHLLTFLKNWQTNAFPSNCHLHERSVIDMTLQPLVCRKT